MLFENPEYSVWKLFACKNTFIFIIIIITNAWLALLQTFGC